jgi:mRNA-degrading endonuclease RelE of RelBE toxin-antitoxin system
MDNRIANTKYGLWRYRVRDYRIICELRDKQLVVLVVAVGIEALSTIDFLKSSMRFFERSHRPPPHCQ